jgi:hypothetical protein
MGFLKNARMVAAANRQMTEFRKLAPLGGNPLPPELGLHQLANFGQRLRLTSGDCGMLAIRALKDFDRFGDTASMVGAVQSDFESGRLRTLAGPPLNQFTDGDSVKLYVQKVCELYR